MKAVVVVHPCKPLLSGIPFFTLRLFHQNSAARILHLTWHSEHMMPCLTAFHWLPVPFHIQQKLPVLTFKAFHALLYIINSLPFNPIFSLPVTVSPPRPSPSAVQRPPLPWRTTHTHTTILTPSIWNGLPRFTGGQLLLSSLLQVVPQEAPVPRGLWHVQELNWPHLLPLASTASPSSESYIKCAQLFSFYRACNQIPLTYWKKSSFKSWTCHSRCPAWSASTFFYPQSNPCELSQALVTCTLRLRKDWNSDLHGKSPKLNMFTRRGIHSIELNGGLGPRKFCLIRFM